ncbi:MAG: hypothetical protein EBZ74_00120 [Planctomycetia bacterium]|nr:hypothetical protein [Planctomycetia bacterium]
MVVLSGDAMAPVRSRLKAGGRRRSVRAIHRSVRRDHARLIAFETLEGRAVLSATTLAKLSGFAPAGSGLGDVRAAANDNFANAIVLTGASASAAGTNVGATREAGEPNILGFSGGRSVWWTWTAPTSGSVQIDTIGSNFDTTLGIFTGTSVNALSTVASNDDGGGNFTSKVNFIASAGTAYQIAVDGYRTATGSISLRVLSTAIPAPTNVSASDGTFSDRVQVTWTSAAGATAYEVWRGTTTVTSAATRVSVVDVTGNSFSDNTAVAGTTYYYWVRSKAGAAVSAFSVGDTGYRRTVVANDGFADAIVLNGASAASSGTNVGATREAGEPNVLGVSGGRSVWWAWTAPTTGSVQIDTIGSTFDTTLGIYTGTTVSGLSTVASNDDSGGNWTSKVIFSATAGTTYRIVVDGYGGSVGTISLHVAQASTPVVVNAAAATVDSLRTASLTVLGSDNGGESGLTYTWTVTSMPAGAAAPTFSSNASNGAKNSVATFAAAGTYVLAVRIANAAGGAVTSSVPVTIAQSLAGATISPSTTSIALNSQTQFSARAVDQFGNAMVSQPIFAWTATVGIIDSATGLYTAPATAGSVTITATSGTTTAQLTATIAAARFLGLRNADLANLVQSLYADGSINRTDMYRILLSVGANDGSVSDSELSDLGTVLSATNAATLQIPGYVQVLANNVVLGSAANARYQGQSLGNLAPGFTASQLTNLVNKWFIGSDRPAANANGSYTYQLAAGTLFVDGPSYTDARQGYVGDCYYIATLGSIAKSNPTAIQNMFVDNGDGTFTVRFYYQNGGNYIADYVTVDRYLPASGTSFIYSNMGSAISSPSNELWMPLAEKAYAQWNETGRSGRNGTNTYSAIEGGWMNVVDRQVLGRSAADYSFSSNANKQVLIDAISANKGVTFGTRASLFGLYGYHAYTVIGYDASTDTFAAYNPWGTSHPGRLTWGQLQQACSFFTVADTSNVPPFSLLIGGLIAPSQPSGYAVPASVDAGMLVAGGVSPTVGDRVTSGVGNAVTFVQQERIVAKAAATATPAQVTQKAFAALAAKGNRASQNVPAGTAHVEELTTSVSGGLSAGERRSSCSVRCTSGYAIASVTPSSLAES